MEIGSPILTTPWRCLAAICLLSAGPLVAASDKTPSKDASELARYDSLIKPADRQHWAFRPVRRPPIPDVKDATWVRNPIDAFILARLERKGWRPAPVALPRSWLRRIFLDLTGLPPTPQEQEAFLRDPSAPAMDRVVDDLLSRPSYGERWGRHWLDLARYGDTNGYERDAVKPSGWRYRDYVIRAFNSDKPFDRFVREQIAGDELPGANAETLIATGFHRLGPWDDEPAEPQQDRSDQLDDMVATTSQVFLGLTLGCARCHNHKFDPLTMLDYYRMVAVFDPLRRPQSGRSELDLPAGSATQIRAVAERDREIRKLLYTVLPAPVAAVGSGYAPMSFLSIALAGQNGKELARCSAKIQELRKETPDLPRAYFLQEHGPTVAATHLLLRGRATRPGPEVRPGFPAVLVRGQPDLPDSMPVSSGRRLALANWIANSENPLTARVIVNRVWQFHFGVGLVSTPSDFGKMGAAPTHPELLDWLADWFVREGWSIKKLHRLILASNTARMSKVASAAYAAKDPENRLWWRLPYRRLEVEAIRDSMLAVSGQLNPKMFGPSMYPHIPKEALAGHSDPDQVWPAFDEREASRRTVYACIKRSLIVPMLEVLDFCDCTRSSAERLVTIIAPQALTLMNGDFVNRQSRYLAKRLLAEVGNDPKKQIDRAYALALCRPPNNAERSALIRFMQQQAGAPNSSPASRGAPDLRPLELACRVILNLNEFVYPD